VVGKSLESSTGSSGDDDGAAVMIIVWSKNISSGCQPCSWCCPEEEEREKRNERDTGWAKLLGRKKMKLGRAKEKKVDVLRGKILNGLG
jgi:hypothetical protein